MTSSFPKSAMHGGEMGVRTPLSLKGGGTKKRKKNGVFSLGKKAAAALREFHPLACAYNESVYLL